MYGFYILPSPVNGRGKAVLCAFAGNERGQHLLATAFVEAHSQVLALHLQHRAEPEFGMEYACAALEGRG